MPSFRNYVCLNCSVVFRTGKPSGNKQEPRFCSRGCYRAFYAARTLLDRLNEYLAPDSLTDDGCWLWQGKPCDNGYGVICPGNGRKQTYAHRAMWEAVNGEIPADMQILHTCDVRLCVNPRHLVLGSFTDNQKDKISKNRHPKGETHWFAVTTEEAVREIRRRYATGKVTLVQLAEDFHMCSANIKKIVRRESWKHVTE